MSLRRRNANIKKKQRSQLIQTQTDAPVRSFCEAGTIDVIAVNESKLDSQIGDNEIQINGYDI